MEARGVLACVCLKKNRKRALCCGLIITDDLHVFACPEDGGKHPEMKPARVERGLSTTRAMFMLPWRFSWNLAI